MSDRRLRPVTIFAPPATTEGHFVDNHTLPDDARHDGMRNDAVHARGQVVAAPRKDEPWPQVAS